MNKGTEQFKRLIILRHGKCTDNLENRLPSPGSPLTKRGIEQARQAAKEIKAKQFSATKIIASSLPRSLETAQIIADITGMTITLEPRLRDGLSEKQLGARIVISVFCTLNSPGELQIVIASISIGQAEKADWNSINASAHLAETISMKKRTWMLSLSVIGW